MRLENAVQMISAAALHTVAPGTWGDLGSGDGTFTLALAEVLAPGSVIHAVDRDAAALKRIPARHHDVRIETHRGDFTQQSLPVDDLDGILMANSLHYVEDQTACIRRWISRMRPAGRFLIVEYDTSQGNQWVPHPVGAAALKDLFGAMGFSSIRVLSSRPSRYQRAPLYAALVER
jgi:trans-aconitate methyltransferase